MENYKNSKIGQETAQKYGDIIEMERPQTEESLRKHPRMTLQNRAKIFSPFSPLRVSNKTGSGQYFVRSTPAIPNPKIEERNE